MSQGGQEDSGCGSESCGMKRTGSESVWIRRRRIVRVSVDFFCSCWNSVSWRRGLIGYGG